MTENKFSNVFFHHSTTIPSLPPALLSSKEEGLQVQ